MGYFFPRCVPWRGDQTDGLTSGSSCRFFERPSGTQAKTRALRIRRLRATATVELNSNQLIHAAVVGSWYYSISAATKLAIRISAPMFHLSSLQKSLRTHKGQSKALVASLLDSSSLRKQTHLEKGLLASKMGGTFQHTVMQGFKNYCKHFPGPKALRRTTEDLEGFFWKLWTLDRGLGTPENSGECSSEAGQSQYNSIRIKHSPRRITDLGSQVDKSRAQFKGRDAGIQSLPTWRNYNKIGWASIPTSSSWMSYKPQFENDSQFPVLLAQHAWEYLVAMMSDLPRSMLNTNQVTTLKFKDLRTLGLQRIVETLRWQRSQRRTQYNFDSMKRGRPSKDSLIEPEHKDVQMELNDWNLAPRSDVPFNCRRNNQVMMDQGYPPVLSSCWLDLETWEQDADMRVTPRPARAVQRREEGRKHCLEESIKYSWTLGVRVQRESGSGTIGGVHPGQAPTSILKIDRQVPTDRQLRFIWLVGGALALKIVLERWMFGGCDGS
ncbi:hypothetical protein DFH06DRAFT_1135681 [Mycena polygramma]|nr:hypothetical protein DFH06DRAFT_1135681 [Mycena polygramma]